MAGSWHPLKASSLTLLWLSLESIICKRYHAIINSFSLYIYCFCHITIVTEMYAIIILKLLPLLGLLLDLVI